jgi:hypothetical protein
VDFYSAALPTLAPLENSGSVNDYEEQFRLLVLDLFSELLAADVFDANVLGMPHLGSFDLVRREVNSDGLVMLQGDREEASTRYVYRAWRARNGQGRGLHFLKTYLQVLFPGQWDVTQIWFSTSDEYPVSTVYNDWWIPRLGDPGLAFDGTWNLGLPVPWRTSGSMSDRDGVYLSSRVRIALDFLQVDTTTVTGLLDVIRGVVPARIVPVIVFWIRDSVSMWGQSNAEVFDLDIDAVVFGDLIAMWGDQSPVIFSDNDQ